METKKHIINLPKNKVAENISIKTENDQIIVNYDLKEKLNLKEGEIYFIETNLNNNFLFIYKNTIDEKLYSYASLFYRNSILYSRIEPVCYINSITFIREASEKEKEKLFNVLVKEGKQWNAEKMCIEDIFDPKDGDFLVNRYGRVFIYSSECVNKNSLGCYCGAYNYVEDGIRLLKSLHWTDRKSCRYATESEKQEFLEKLKEAGYTWNAEKKCLEEYVWKPKYGERFYYIHVDFKVYEGEFYDTLLNYNMINANNCFQTEEQAERKAKELREVLKKK